MIKILVAEGSAVVRSVIKEIISSTRELCVSSDAASLEELEKKARSERPDFIILDSNITREKNAATLAFRIKPLRLPAVIFCSPQEPENSMQEISIVRRPDFMKLSSQQILFLAAEWEKHIVRTTREGLLEKQARPHEERTTRAEESTGGHRAAPQGKGKYRAVLVGVSTGGPGTIHTLLNSIGKDFPLPIIITQHIDSFFDRSLIEWLNQNCPMRVQLVEQSVHPEGGSVYFAPSDNHLQLRLDSEGRLLVDLNQDPPVNFLRPSVDKMFDSAAEALGSRCIGVLLTGMGADGAEGCCKIKSRGGYTITQSKESCVIYGMPRAAVDAGGSCEILELEKIAERLRELAGAEK